MAVTYSCDVVHTVCSGVPSLGRAELQAACEDFINVIGSSSDCTLYKGTLSSGVEIAVVSTSVNSAKDWTDRTEEQFKNKVIRQCAKLWSIQLVFHCCSVVCLILLNINCSCFRYLSYPE